MRLLVVCEVVGDVRGCWRCVRLLEVCEVVGGV